MNVYEDEENGFYIDNSGNIKQSARTNSLHRLIVKMITKHQIKRVDPANFEKMHKINDKINKMKLTFNYNLEKKFDEKMQIRIALDGQPHSERNTALADVEKRLSNIEIGDIITVKEYKEIQYLIRKHHLNDSLYEQRLSGGSIQKLKDLKDLMKALELIK